MAHALGWIGTNTMIMPGRAGSNCSSPRLGLRFLEALRHRRHDHLDCHGHHHDRDAQIKTMVKSPNPGLTLIPTPSMPRPEKITL